MAKKSVASLQTGSGRTHTKCIKMVKNEKDGHSFSEGMIVNEKIKDFFAKK
ncbi:MAG: DUF4295 domain-containing protein [Bacteroidota bacterium]|nr:DUF4295 domain-containing protein [Bacteroidota bacterium]